MISSRRRAASASSYWSSGWSVMSARMVRTYQENKPLIIGCCIYCGATEYFPGSKEPPHLEHVIPEAINGTILLGEASCRACERRINPWETKLLKGALLGCRTYLKLDTKRPKDRPSSLPLFDTQVEPNQKHQIPLIDYPASLLLPLLGAPGEHRYTNSLSQTNGAWIRFFNNNLEVIKNKYGLSETATANLDFYAFCRILAKIAHGFAVLSLGMNGFIPILPNFIMGKHDIHMLHYVGGYSEIPPASANLHEIGIEDPTDRTWKHIVVTVRLFAQFGAPVYRIIAGDRINPKPPLGVLLAQASVLRNSQKNFSENPTSHPIPVGLWDPNVPSSSSIPVPNFQRWIRANMKVT